MKIYAVHGFLGSSTDWQNVQQHTKNSEWSGADLFTGADRITRSATFDSVVEKLRQSCRSFLNAKSTKFIGYSLGGRIGLHWLEKYPQDFEHWFFLSTHPGLKNDFEREQRKISDQKWIKDLQNLNRSQFLEKWEGQAVFAKTAKTNVSAHQLLEWNTDSLQAGLSGLSLSQQKNFRDVIHEHRQKLSWIVGEKDVKFRNLAEELKTSSVLENIHCLPCGHRIHLERAEPLAKLLTAQ